MLPTKAVCDYAIVLIARGVRPVRLSEDDAHRLSDCLRTAAPDGSVSIEPRAVRPLAVDRAELGRQLEQAFAIIDEHRRG